MPDTHTLLLVFVIALVTAALRFLPFFVFRGGRKSPRIVEKLGGLLPYAVMGMLVVYCLRDVRFTSPSGFVPSFVACLAVGILYVWKRNTLVSIVVGTATYMLLLRLL